MKRPIRKVFFQAEQAGNQTEYWEGQWDDDVRTFDGQVRRLLAAHLPSGGRVLEAGCGQGQVVAGLASLGHTVVGIDLAQRALADCHHRQPTLPLSVADVGQMPFPDATFNAVVSLGVVEHFEPGPLPVLQEHRRVLDDEGVLFLTAPARGWYRTWTDFRHLQLGRAITYEQRGRTVALRSETRTEKMLDRTFHQYEFPRGRLVELLGAAGFDVELWQPFDVAAALGESPVLAWLASKRASGTDDKLSAMKEDGTRNPTASPNAAGPLVGVRRVVRKSADYLRTPIIEETHGDVLQRALAHVATRALSHMQLLVARPASSCSRRSGHS